MIDLQKLIRRHDRICAVWRRTKSANTAERCRLRLAAIARQARKEFDRTVTAVLPLPGSTACAGDLENAGDVARPGNGATPKKKTT